MKTQWNFILCCICFAQFAFSQTPYKINAAALEKPILLHKGQTINLQCDSAVLISSNRFQLYEKAKSTILNTNDNHFNDLFEAYDAQIRTYKQWNDSLQLKYTEMNLVFKSTIDNTKSHLLDINKNLSSAKDSLGLANNQLNEALHHLNTAKREKWFFGTIGLLVGALTTVLLIGK